MSVLIKNMEIPEHCGYCRFRYDGICHALQKTQYSVEECPLVSVNDINAAPTIEPQQWIPVTERLPKEPCIACDKFGQIFIPYGTVKIDDKCYDARKFNFNPKEFLRGEIVKMAGGKTVRILPNEIIAWMPFPEPWKGGAKDGN